MEILVAVIAFAGALLAAVAAGALIQRLRDEPEGWLVAWTVAVVGLCLSLGVIGVGSFFGFGGVTFRIYQVTGSLIAPLWLAIGLVQLLSEKVPPRFLAWLLGIALTFVSVVIMVWDPLKTEEMGKSLPTASTHWNVFPGYLLTGAHVVALIVMLAMLVVAGLKWRNGDEYDTDNLHATVVIVPSGLALVGAMRFPVPGLFTTALLAVAAAAVWYTVLRPLAPYEDDDEDDFDDDREERAPRREERSQRREERPIALDEHRMTPGERPMFRDEVPQQGGHRGMPEPVPAADLPPAPPRRSSGLGDLVAEYRAGDEGYRQREVDYAARMAAPLDDGPSTGYIMNGAPPASAPMTPPAPATGAVFPGADLFSPAQQQPGSGRPSPHIYGLLTVFTIVDGAGDAFDRLAEATVEAVRRGEPDTLVYACHAVKSAPLQRIVYELYRDEVAYRDHQRQPHVERFVNERQAMVLATNVIELDVNAAKVVPLPTVSY
ncbi:quinol monooxygenase YgiN [Nonomuraea thailandensis]|uniref:Quinol monooxygenase YgiN n=1 Tax=Nonomuraea thailandensis TaxID=1188745 RepID=A0A9X2GW21_9ACTN|nr:antibiotic biosynthesis monooxygenase [Nonomuraea thailandensis]MCP2362761.1 quinol monooxygenase YgiN [Nonomuraea thailandensis]